MGTSATPSAGDRISANIAAMRSQGASEHDIETYLTQYEGLTPEEHTPGAMETLGSIARATNPQMALQELRDPNSGTRHMLRQAVQGATANYGDEILRKLPTWLGGGDQAADEMKARDQAFRAENPMLSADAKMGGAVGAGLLAPEVKTAGLLASVGKGALIGAGGTAAAISGDAEPGARMQAVRDNAGTIGIGGLLGGGIPALAGGLAALGASGSGASRLARAIQQSGGKSAVLAKNVEFGKAGLGDVTTLGDLTDPLRAASKYAVQNSEEAAMPRIRATQARNAGTPQRMMDKMRGLLPEFGADPNAPDASNALKLETRNWANSPEGYAGLREDNPTVANTAMPRVQSPELTQALADLKGAKALGVGGPALANLQARVDALRPPPLSDVEQGFAKVLQQPKVRDAVYEAKQTGLIGSTPEPGMVPSFAKMLQIKANVQDAADRAFTAGGGKSQLGANLKEAAQIIDQHLADNVPNYRDVTQEYATRMGQSRAFDLGHDLFQSGDSRQIAAKMQQLTPEELHNARLSMASDMVAKLRKPAEAQTFARQIMASGAEGSSENALQDKLLATFGSPEKFQEYMQFAKLNHELSRMTGAYSGSDTYRNFMSGSTTPVDEVGKVAKSSSPTTAAKHFVLDRVLKQVRRQGASEMAGSLMQTGTKNIGDEIDKLLAQRAPLAGRGSSQVAPFAIPQFLQGLLTPQP